MSGALDILRLLTRLKNRRIHLGVTGSVSCYKSVELLRHLGACGVHVSATVSAGARQFVTPLLFESLGALPVYTEMFQPGEDPFAHLEPGQNAQAFFVVPASASSLARIAHGEASDMLSAQALAFDGPLLIAPAMNPRMWNNPATQANVSTLASRGVTIVSPDAGCMACGECGTGRLSPVPHLFLHALRAIADQDMAGRKVLVTLGPTREPWDGVRFWSNPSTGTMGASLCLAAWIRGADVTAIVGPGVDKDLVPHTIPGLTRCDVGTACEMFEASNDCWPAMDFGMFSAAVADFSPVRYGEAKFKKEGVGDFSVSFTPNRDILATLSSLKNPSQKILGFAAETAPSMEDLLVLAERKRQRKDCDLLAANCVNAKGSGFGVPTNSMAVTTASGKQEIWPVQSKADVAWDLCTWLLNA